MGRKIINRIGEKGINNFGSEMIIVRYKMRRDIDVYFSEYNWTAKRVRYDNFKNGNVKCPYERRIYGVGYLGEGKYKAYENGKQTRLYHTWQSMLGRCYDEKYHKRHPTYKNCKVCEEWHNFQNFAEWHYNNYYDVDDETMCLDKDILFKGNKFYSPETCMFVPITINSLFVKRDNDRGESVIGVSYHKRDRIYEVWCSLINPETGKSKGKYLGRYDSQEKAFQVYKYYKEKNIKQIADYYKDKITEKLYKALYNYEVEITD